jgi:hypothetical protein
MTFQAIPLLETLLFLLFSSKRIIIHHESRIRPGSYLAFGKAAIMTGVVKTFGSQ